MQSLSSTSREFSGACVVAGAGVGVVGFILFRRWSKTRAEPPHDLDGSTAWKAWELPPADRARLDALRGRLVETTGRTIGLPGYYGNKWTEWAEFAGQTINNLGGVDGGGSPLNVKDLEREVLDTAARELGADPGSVRGYITTGGSTEGNMWALYLAREALGGNPVMVYSSQSHYSMPKIAHILRFDVEVVPAGEDGGIDVAALSERLRTIDPKRGCVVVANVGTTFLGGIDDVPAVKAALEETLPGRHVLHADAALFGMLLPFVWEDDGAPRGDFASGADSIAISGHKLLGCPMPCSIALATRSLVDGEIGLGGTQASTERCECAETRGSDGVKKKVDDVTITGSRNGHVVVAMWVLFRRLFGVPGRWKAECKRFLAQARYAERRLREIGLNPSRAPGSIIVVFDSPSEATQHRHTLMCVNGRCHITTHNATPAKIDRLVTDIQNSRLPVGGFK